MHVSNELQVSQQQGGVTALILHVTHGGRVSAACHGPPETRTVSPAARGRLHGAHTDVCNTEQNLAPV